MKSHNDTSEFNQQYMSKSRLRYAPAVSNILARVTPECPPDQSTTKQAFQVHTPISKAYSNVLSHAHPDYSGVVCVAA
jgi:hypothetical protein